MSDYDQTESEDAAQTDGDQTSPQPPSTAEDGGRPSPMQPQKLVWMGLLLEGFLLLLGLGIAWYFNFFDRDRPPGEFFSGNWVFELVLGALLSIPLLGIFLWVMEWKSPALNDFRKLVDEQLAPLFRPLNIWQVVVISLAAGIGEEMLFRWCVQGGLMQFVTLALAILITSVAFGVCHWVSATYALMAGALSVIIGLVYWQWGPLTAIALHAMYDFLAIQFLVKSRPDPPVAPVALSQSASIDGVNQG